jgi:dGTPase
MFEKVYIREETKKERLNAKNIIEKLVLSFEKDPSLLPLKYQNNQSDIENAVDYVAGMTDRYAIKKYEEL